MDQRGYVLRRDANVVPLSKALRVNAFRWEWVRRYEPMAHPHPRLRALLKDVTPNLLSLPWLPPTAPWWPLGGQFARVVAKAKEDKTEVSKALIFSRFRAVPRILASALSYEAERAAFGREAQRRQTGSFERYDYAARSRIHGAGSESFRPCGSPQPRPAFVFARSRKPESGLPLLLEFFPLPALAALGDPLLDLADAGPGVPADFLTGRIRARLEAKLGRAVRSGPRRPLWRWVRWLEQQSSSWKDVRSGWTQWMKAAPDAHRAAHRVASFFLDAADTQPPPPSEAELHELAKIALLSPACVLLRAVSRVFGPTLDGATRIQRVTQVAVECFRGYLDTTEFHMLMPGKNHRSAVHDAIWAGNLESVLDEYLATLAGLGEETPKEGRESRAMEALATALDIRASSIELNAPSRDTKFKVRCHAALPLGLNPSEVVSEGGRIRSDFLRIAFNSPFRPFVLATTSVGQEGLDFHTYCSHLIHWDLPGNAVDLEQRDGRIRRFGSLAVRKAMADGPVRLKPGVSPWRTLAHKQPEGAGGLVPWWSHPGARIQRTVYIPYFSDSEDTLGRLLSSLALYRMALGQPDQEQLVRALHRRLQGGEAERAALLEWFHSARLCLSPYFQSAQGQNVQPLIRAATSHK
jgi:hypothetical protein